MNLTIYFKNPTTLNCLSNSIMATRGGLPLFIFHEVVVSLKIIPTFALALYQHGQLSICGDLRPRILTIEI